MNSINANVSTLAGVTALDAASQQVAQSQNRISTGLKVASAKDDGAAWSIAQHMRSQATGWQVVSDSLNRGQSILDVATSGAADIGDLLKQLQAKALSYSDTSLDAASRSSLQTDITALIRQIDRTANSADFQGVNLLDVPQNTVVPVDLNPPPAAPFGTGFSQWFWSASAPPVAGTITFAFSSPASDLSVSHPINYGAQSLSPPQIYLSGTPVVRGPDPVVSFPWTGSSLFWPQIHADDSTTLLSATFTPDGPPPKNIQVITDPNGGKATLSTFDLTSKGLSLDALDWSDPQSVIAAVNSAVSTATNASMTIGSQQGYLTSSQQTAQTAQANLQTGVSNLVDADMGVESAKLQAAQSKQQLAAKALAIANAAPQWILALFR